MLLSAGSFLVLSTLIAPPPVSREIVAPECVERRCGRPMPIASLDTFPPSAEPFSPIVRLSKGTLMKESKDRSRAELLPGTLEMLILKTLSIETMHGYGIAQHIQKISADVLKVEEGSLYPALQRMLLKGWVTAEWKISANNRRARYYSLTAAGRQQLGVEESNFDQMFGAILKVMRAS
jgi:PadR family transcriptional regulator, regulatory protein PadR